VLLMQSMRYLRGWQHRGRKVGVGLSRVVVLFVAGMFPVLVAEAIRNPDLVPPFTPPWSRARAHIETQLEQTTGQHLVIVRYSPGHPWEEEVVYNLADIDHSKVVWARENPGTDMRPLLSYFSTRHVWLLQPDISSQVTPYPMTRAQGSN
jgi:hypothetical protein